MLNDRNPAFQALTDKVAVREHVRKKGLENILSRHYLVTEDLDSLDFESFPRPFVVKPSHASGRIVFVQPRQSIDWEEIRRLCKEWMETDYSTVNREWQYHKIKPRIIIEEWLGEWEALRTELKFHCIHGEPRIIDVILDQINVERLVRKYDINWQPVGLDIKRKRQIDIPRPAKLEEMLEIARSLAREFDYVRVDLYHLPERIVFGELTFTEGAGNSTKSMEIQIELGNAWHLPT